jgi:hypothetical protein
LEGNGGQTDHYAIEHMPVWIVGTRSIAANALVFFDIGILSDGEIRSI